MLEFLPLRKYLMGKMFPPGIYEYVCARTNVIDAVFLSALDDHFAQVVLLGAGFDTRALRFADRNLGTTIFELDVPATQKPKLQIYCKNKFVIPPWLVFASIDFNRERITDVLHKAGYQDGQQTLFIWEGVSMYLSAEAVNSTLTFIQSCAAPGSQVVFDYLYASVLRQENRYYGEQEIYRLVFRSGEGWTFGLEEGEAEPFLAARGFEMLAHYTPVELETRFLTAEDGTSYGRVNGTHCIVVAAVK
jgi:methyltransferase (TIGR00027 family)